MSGTSTRRIAGSLLIGLVLAICPTVQAEKEKGWVEVFDGKSIADWKPYSNEGELIPPDKSAFSVKDGVLHCSGNGPDYWITIPGVYSDCEFELEYKFAEDANSGIFLRAPDPDLPAYKGFEVQIIDDYGDFPDHHGNGSIYDVIGVMRNMTKPVGEWNKMSVWLKGSEIRIVHNGFKIIDTDFSQLTEPIGKFDFPYANLPKEGMIGLQNHGGEIWFRNIRLRKLD